ncbi:MAG TPA: ATP synthase F0 subunit C [Flexilinea sp.]|nr:ATP synthase F0 subunit C [Flexilinea sp.]HPS48662.1 ATP synthase F0 subunit C [Flexilinea sp.]
MDPQVGKYIGAGLVMISTIGAGIAIGNIGKSALDGISRNPDAYGNLMTTMILAIAFAESLAIYSLVVAFLILFG